MGVLHLTTFISSKLIYLDYFKIPFASFVYLKPTRLLAHAQAVLT